ncbi:spore coat protein [Candidatus Omnitrophus magneticus]|uniref:dTDP-glucose 4,6-dehydratase n=1 Tax=Candidatus Omnitrophus magneticus TaxID=1609969 RepID=A0A0F0CJN9_9BACT|nr:spore coat protein [Candidatus Omnitrophus magneticus]
MRKMLVTGGAGFIGSEFVRQAALEKSNKIIVIDKLSYAGDLERLAELKDKYTFYNSDIRDKKNISRIFSKEKPDIIVHFAAETHVDRSILDGTIFIESNIKGTQILMDAARAIGTPRFIHISTDEVYGEIRKGKFLEESPFRPNSPYAVSKAGADLLVQSYIRTYNFPAIIIRASNNYGPWQYPEKFIPVIIAKIMNGEKIPVYGKGLQCREWLYVSDCAEAVRFVTENGKIGESYNIGSGIEKTNIAVAKKTLNALGKNNSHIEFVQDRPGHDFRYALNIKKIKELGWSPKIDFTEGITKTVQWYKDNSPWLMSKMNSIKKYWKKVYKKI